MFKNKITWNHNPVMCFWVLTDFRFSCVHWRPHLLFFMAKKKGGGWGDGEEVCQVSRPKNLRSSTLRVFVGGGLGVGCNDFQSCNTQGNRASECEKMRYFYILFPKYSRWNCMRVFKSIGNLIPFLDMSRFWCLTMT